MPARKQTPETFWAKVDKTDTCWIWTGTMVRGYGKVSFAGRLLGAHRVAYELAVGPIPEGLQIDHLCRVAECVNPAHLEPVTALENMRRARPYRDVPRIEACRRGGHPYTDGNTYTHPNGRRSCRTCARERDRRRKAAARADRVAA